MDSNDAPLMEQVELTISIPMRTPSAERITWFLTLPIVLRFPANVTLVSDKHPSNALLWISLICPNSSISVICEHSEKKSSGIVVIPC